MVFKQKQAEKPFYRRHGYLLSIPLTSISFASWFCREFNSYVDRLNEGSDLESARAAVADLERKRSLLADAYLAGSMPQDVYAAKSEEVERLYKEARTKAAAMSGQAIKKADPEAVRAAFSHYVDQWKDDSKRSLFYRCFIEKATVYLDRIDIVFKTPGGPVKGVAHLARRVPGTKRKENQRKCWFFVPFFNDNSAKLGKFCHRFNPIKIEKKR